MRLIIGGQAQGKLALALAETPGAQVTDGETCTLAEASRDLGASPVRTFFEITLPLIMPGVLSGVMLAFAMSLDDFVISFFVTGATTTTLPLRIYSSVRTGVSLQVNALCTLTLAFVAIVMAFKQLVVDRRANR